MITGDKPLRVLYYYSKLNIGGAERSTVRLLNALSRKDHDVTLLLRWDGGALEKELDPDVRVVYLKKGLLREGTFFGILLQLKESILMQLRLAEIRKEQFDVAVNGLFGYNPALLFNRVKAKQYYQMLRNDVSETVSYGKTSEYMAIYGDKFDAYIGVSQYTTESFCAVYPHLSHKAYTLYNILPEIPSGKWEKPWQYLADGKLRILTVCRLSDKAKGLFRMVKVCSALSERYGDCFTWYIVGAGPDEERLKEKISEAGMNSQMILCGETSNPYPFYAYADIVAVLSYYEGLCGVVNEAKLMKKPIIATRFSGIDEQLTDGKNGLIVENAEDDIISGLCRLVESAELRDKLSVNGMPEALLNNDIKIAEFENLYIKLAEDKRNG